MPQLTDAQKWKIVYLFNDLQLTQQQIAKRVNCTRQTVASVLQKYSETATVSDRQRSGRPSLMNQQSLKRLDRIINKHDSYTSTALADEMRKQSGIRISPRTIRRVRKTALARHPVREHIVKSLKPGEMTKRLNFANNNINNNFHNVFFSDEKLFVLAKTGTVHWVKKGSDPPSKEVEDMKASVLVWGAVSWSYKSTIHTCSKTVNANYYTQILTTHLLPTMPNFSRYLFQHDNASPHTAKHTMNWLAGIGVKVLDDWPPYSPELNIIEHVWSWMTAYINKERPKNRRELKRYIRAAWNEIPQSTIQAYINNLPTVMKRIIDAKGDNI